MNILHLAYRNTSGVPGRWADAHRAAGADARLLVELEHPFAYGHAETVERWTPGSVSAEDRADRIAGHLDWADVVMAYDHPFYLDTAVASGKPVLFRALGQSAREHRREITGLIAAASVARASAGTADLALLLDVELAGAPYPLPEPAAPDGSLTLCHCPSDRESKGTDRVLRAADAAGWDVVLVEGAANADVLEQKRRCALVVDACGPGTVPDGYGVNAVEAMALGLPVISSASNTVARMLRQAGSPALFARDEHQLALALEGMKDEAVRRELGHLGREFVRSFHSSARAAEDVAAVERLQVAA